MVYDVRHKAVILTLYANGEKINAYKMVRYWTNCGLAEAKLETEALLSDPSIPIIPIDLAHRVIDSFRQFQATMMDVLAHIGETNGTPER
jgi:NDP-sugar pyrophosphorylase family protein